jgi:pimeloyl-ACP methyl ester carboxylesterase/isoprenylcysteine carboxyl methyltransferase (ICMT) family protein YpbQ
MKVQFQEFARALESRVLPLLFVYFVVEQVIVLYTGRAAIAVGLRAAATQPLDMAAVTTVSLLCVRLMLILINAAGVVFLLKSPQQRRYTVERPGDVIVPLFSTFFILVTNILSYLPAPTNFRLLPEHLSGTLTLVGLQLAVVGSAISLLGVWSLGDSFAIFVQQRTLVRGGIYRYVRHPIYLGHCVRMAGYWLMTTFTHHLLFTLVGIGLLVYRARMEEARFVEATGDAYRKYKDGTSRLAPRLVASGAAVVAVCVLAASVTSTRFEAARLDRALREGIQQVDGPGLPVVFVHGAGGSKKVWSNQLAYLRDRHRAIALDLLRRAYEGVPPEDAGAIYDGVRDIETAVAALGVPRFVLVGHSLGAHSSIEFARRHPDQVAGLLLVDPSGDYRWLPPRHQRMWRSRFEDHKRRLAIWGTLLRGSKEATRKLVLEDLEATPESTFRNVSQVLFSYDPATPFDRYPGPKLSVYSACEGGGANSRFSPLPRKCMSNVSHWVMLDDPDKLNKILDEFLARIPGEGGGPSPDRTLL